MKTLGRSVGSPMLSSAVSRVQGLRHFDWETGEEGETAVVMGYLRTLGLAIIQAQCVCLFSRIKNPQEKHCRKREAKARRSSCIRNWNSTQAFCGTRC